MRNVAAIIPGALLFALTACGGGGLESEQCKAYFAKVEECTSKMENEIKADVLKKTAETSKEEWKKNANPMAVSKGCELMLEQLNNDADCK